MKVFVAITEPGNPREPIFTYCATQEELNSAIEKVKSYLDDIANDFDETDLGVYNVILNYGFIDSERSESHDVP